MLAWHKKDLALYAIPPLANAQAPVVTKAARVWETRLQKKLGEMKTEPPLAQGPKYVSDELLLIDQLGFLEMLNLETGQTVWSKKKKMMSTGLRMTFSPNGMYGAITSGTKLLVMDMASGRDIAEIPVPGGSILKAVPRIIWRDLDDLVLVFSDAKMRPGSISRIDVTRRAVIWSKTLPGPADYRMTSGEKKGLAARIAVALAMTAVSAANPTVSGGYSTTYVFVPNVDVKRLPDSNAGLEAMQAELMGREETMETRAMSRYIERSRMLSDVLGKRGLFVAGHDDRYQIYDFDMYGGAASVVAEYNAPKVHGIEPDVVYGLAIIEEAERLKVNVLALGDT